MTKKAVLIKMIFKEKNSNVSLLQNRAKIDSKRFML